MTAPTIYLSNWSSHKTPGHHGPGKRYTIMASPREWEHGAGLVAALTPPRGSMKAVKQGRKSFPTYQRELLQLWGKDGDIVEPGKLSALVPGGRWAQVRDGDTLCCSCARGKPCHRQIAAQVLARAGWDVVLDGVPLGRPKPARPSAEIVCRKCQGSTRDFGRWVAARRCDNPDCATVTPAAAPSTREPLIGNVRGEPCPHCSVGYLDRDPTDDDWLVCSRRCGLRQLNPETPDA